MSKSIQVTKKSFDYFPKEVVIDNQTFNVDSVKKCWTISSRRRLATVTHHGFVLQIGKRLMTVIHDIQGDTWQIKKSP
jgi:hypothetical protein